MINAGYALYMNGKLCKIDWDKTTNDFDIFAEIMRERAIAASYQPIYYGDIYGYDYYIGRINKSLRKYYLPEDIIQTVCPYARI